MRSSVEFSIDLTAQELLAPGAPRAEVAEVAEVAKGGAAREAADVDAVEIELTAEQMNALLEGKLEL